jgi:hypothetical protein
MKTILLNDGTILTIKKTGDGITYNHNNNILNETNPLTKSGLLKWLKETNTNPLSGPKDLGGITMGHHKYW